MGKTMSEPWHLTIDITETALTVSDGTTTRPIQNEMDSRRFALTERYVTIRDGTTVAAEELLTSTMWGCLAVCGQSRPPLSATIKTPIPPSPPNSQAIALAFAQYGVHPESVTIETTASSAGAETTTAEPASAFPDGDWKLVAEQPSSPFGHHEKPSEVPSSQASTSSTATKKKMSPILIIVIAIVAIAVVTVAALVARSYLASSRDELLPDMVPDEIANAVEECTSKNDFVNSSGDVVEQIHCRISERLTDDDSGQAFRVYGAYFYSDPDVVDYMAAAPLIPNEVPLGTTIPENRVVRVLQEANSPTSIYQIEDSLLGVYGATGIDPDDVDALVRAMGLNR